MSFQVEVTQLPSHAGNFADLRDYVGKDALAIRHHPDGPWTYVLYKTPLAETALPIIDTYAIGGVTITLAETIVKGTTGAARHRGGVGKTRGGLLGGRPAIGMGLRGRHPVHFPRSAGPMSDPIATNESFEIKRVQMMAAAAMSAFMHQLGGIYPPPYRERLEPEPLRALPQRRPLAQGRPDYRLSPRRPRSS